MSEDTEKNYPIVLVRSKSESPTKKDVLKGEFRVEDKVPVGWDDPDNWIDFGTDHQRPKARGGEIFRHWFQQESKKTKARQEQKEEERRQNREVALLLSELYSSQPGQPLIVNEHQAERTRRQLDERGVHHGWSRHDPDDRTSRNGPVISSLVESFNPLLGFSEIKLPPDIRPETKGEKDCRGWLENSVAQARSEVSFFESNVRFDKPPVEYTEEKRVLNQTLAQRIRWQEKKIKSEGRARVKQLERDRIKRETVQILVSTIRQSSIFR